MTRRARGRTLCLIGVALLAACAKGRAVLEVSGTIMYEKPAIATVTHDLTDSRSDGGSVTVMVSMTGDAGLEASFDVYPGVAERVLMKEVGEGRYAGEFSFPDAVVGGPFTMVVRLRHPEAGEAVWRDPNLITIPLLEPAR